MFTNITRRMTIGLGLALVVGSLIVADAGSARAQANAQPATTTQTIVPATYNQMGGHGPMGGRSMGPGYGHGMMMGASYGQTGHMGHWNGQASAQYHGGQGGCW